MNAPNSHKAHMFDAKQMAEQSLSQSPVTVYAAYNKHLIPPKFGIKS